ncbi:hypothetical protein [Streptomyces sp. NPDC050504]|uniref:hypothetical protein n=1 Tax=Streptomyces sp. NPDC050504 TaxID=3365618 RepID=UPI0037BB1F32
MSKTSTPRTTVPDTAWLGRGRHLGSSPEQDVRRNLIALKAAGVVDDFLDLDPADAAPPAGLPPLPGAQTGFEPAAPSPRRLFEARWREEDDVTVRAQLTTYDLEGHRRSEVVGWVLAADAGTLWDERWASPATMFWPDTERVAWDHDAVQGPLLRAANPLPADEKELRALLRECTRHSWNIQVVVHEAMTADAVGQLSLTRFLPPGLRHRVIEHRAAPEQHQIVNWAVKDLNVQVPRGGAVVLPTALTGPEYTAEDFTVRSVFLDGSEPTELVEKIVAFADLPQTATEEVERVLTHLRRRWHLLTEDEQLVYARTLVVSYAEALDAMTKSRDLYREAAELAHAALAEANGPGGAAPGRPAAGADEGPFGALGRALGRFKGPRRDKE